MGNEAEDGKGTGGEREGCGPRMGALLFERRDGCAREDGRKGVRSRAPQERRSNNLTFGALFACGHAGLPWLGEGGMRGPAESNIYTIEAGCRHGHRRASSARASVERACALEAPRPCRRTHTLRRTSLHPGGPMGTTTRRGPARRARSIALSACAPGNDGDGRAPTEGRKALSSHDERHAPWRQPRCRLLQRPCLAKSHARRHRTQQAIELDRPTRPHRTYVSVSVLRCCEQLARRPRTLECVVNVRVETCTARRYTLGARTALGSMWHTYARRPAAARAIQIQRASATRGDGHGARRGGRMRP